LGFLGLAGRGWDRGRFLKMKAFGVLAAAKIVGIAATEPHSGCSESID
jgi:hypothetical protein